MVLVRQNLVIRISLKILISMVDLIQASSIRIKSMADGSLDLTVRIEPKDMIAAVALFGAPGIAIVLGRLLANHEKETDDEEKEEAEKPKGGPLSKLAGQWCNDEVFWKFLRQRYGEDCTSSLMAANVLRTLCDVDSRARIDHDDNAKAEFHKIRQGFMNWRDYK